MNKHNYDYDCDVTILWFMNGQKCGGTAISGSKLGC